MKQFNFIPECHESHSTIFINTINKKNHESSHRFIVIGQDADFNDDNLILERKPGILTGRFFFK